MGQRVALIHHESCVAELHFFEIFDSSLQATKTYEVEVPIMKKAFSHLKANKGKEEL